MHTFSFQTGSKRASTNQGFTLIELLVVIAVIGILMSLTLPAVQAVREAARRTTCKNNLRQVTLALQNYESSFKRLPAGWIGDPVDNLPGWGWASQILPYMEEGNVYDRIDFTLPISDPSHIQIVTTVIPTFLCPSDPHQEIANLFHTADHGGAHLQAPGSPPQVTDPYPCARGNFSGVFGISEIEDQPDAGEGVFYRNSKTRLAEITDGLSNTLMVGERSSDLGWVTWLGVINEVDEPMTRILGTADHVPNAQHTHFEDFRSHHHGGVHFATAGGSTHMIANTIDLNVYKSMCTRNGHEPFAGEF